MQGKRLLSLKVDVDTHDGMRDGVPRLLEIFRHENVRVTFFLSFGPDNAGKAIFNIFKQKGFLKKMVKTRAPSLYGLRTVLSGTLLPARPIATKFPEIVRQIEKEGHECEIHAWDHRFWQDHIASMSLQEIERQFQQAQKAYINILGHSAQAVAAPSWKITSTVLEVESNLSFTYASDLRDGHPCFLTYDKDKLSPLQIPTTGPCLEELLTLGINREEQWISEIIGAVSESPWPVIALHAEVEGGPYTGFLKSLVSKLKSHGYTIIPLLTMAQTLHNLNAMSRQVIPIRRLARTTLPGRAGWVSTSSQIR